VGWWSRRNRHQDVADTLDRALGRILDAQASQIESASKFLATMSDLSTRKAAQTLGSRGGRKRADNAARKKTASTCELCRDPMFKAVTVEMIAAHRLHTSGTAPEPNGEVKDQ